MPFRITWDGKSWLTEDLTLNEAVLIEAEVGEPWTYAISAPLKTAVHSKALMKQLLAREHGSEKAADLAGQMTMKQLITAIEIVPDDRPEQFENGIPVTDPKADAAATVTSK